MFGRDESTRLGYLRTYAFPIISVFYFRSFLSTVFISLIVDTFSIFFYGTASLSSPTAPADVAKEQELLGDDGGCVLVTPGRHTPFRSLRMRWGSLFDVSMDLLDALVGPF